jgi:acid phosphatase (class A)
LLQSELSNWEDTLMKKLVLPLFAFCFVIASKAAFAYDAAYISTQQLNLSKILAPSPSASSELQRQDMGEVLRLQQSRTSTQAERAVADNEQTLGRIANEVFGDKASALRSPKFVAFAERVTQDTRAIFLASKDVWNRPRPYSVSTEVKAIGELPTTGSYPSGHATRGYLVAILLSNMVPEKSNELFARGREYGENRVLAGVHYPTDVEAGRLSATAIAAALMQSERFMKDFNDAKAELRQALGLDTH